jgi:hypothetical protein
MLRLRGTTIDGLVEIQFQDLGASSDKYVGDYISIFAKYGKARNIRSPNIDADRMRCDLAALRDAGVLSAYLGDTCIIEHPDTESIMGDQT